MHSWILAIALLLPYLASAGHPHHHHARGHKATSTKVNSNKPSSTKAASSNCTVSDISQLTYCKGSCSTINIGNLQVPAGQTLDLTKLKDGTNVIFTGKVTFGYKEWIGPLVSVSGTNIKVQGKEGCLFDGEGQRWWDALGGNGGKLKPKFFFAHSLTDSSISGINIKNSPVHIFSIGNANGLTLSNIHIDNTLGDTQGGHNTDAFDVGSSTDVTIQDSIVYNQDDCLAVNSGKNIKFSNVYCSGGHGISIGSVGGRSNNDVDTVTITGCTVCDSENGLRIKTNVGTTGSVTNILYSNITLKNVDHGIMIRQDYTNKGYTGNATAGVPISNVVMKDIKGTVSSKGLGYSINCAKGACTNWTWQNVSLKTADGYSTAQNQCVNAPACVGCSQKQSRR